MVLLLGIVILCSIILLSLSLLPVVMQKAQSWQQKQEVMVAREMDKIFYDQNPKVIVMLYPILPVVFGLSGLIFLRSPFFMIFGALAGIIIPSLILKMRFKRRVQKFSGQLLDAINMLTSCLKGGLSLLQGIEVLVEEMPAPISQELGLVIRENKMGISLEESLVRLNKRMNLEELGLMVNALLIAREDRR